MTGIAHQAKSKRSLIDKKIVEILLDMLSGKMSASEVCRK
jgi:hypothetical protein